MLTRCSNCHLGRSFVNSGGGTGPTEVMFRGPAAPQLPHLTSHPCWALCSPD